MDFPEKNYKNQLLQDFGNMTIIKEFRKIIN